MEEVLAKFLGRNSTGEDGWFSDDDSSLVLVTLEDKESGLGWREKFVPPPPRPLFLEETATPDGLTTCDLCTWAWQGGGVFGPKVSLGGDGHLGWVLTLVIVSLISAVMGAIIMTTVMRCKSRTKTRVNEASTRSSPPRSQLQIPDDKASTANQALEATSKSNVWSWLSRRTSNSPPTQLTNPYPSPAPENHYTHMGENYSEVEEVIYDELDGEGSVRKEGKNQTYADVEAHTSDAPSSAYYSDLSVSTVPERAYEIVTLNNLSVWEKRGEVAVMCENGNKPSEYV